MKCLFLQTKILLLKSGIRKDVAVSINKESMNKSSSKLYFSGFSFFTLLLVLLAAKGVLKNFAIFSVFNNVAVPRVCNFMEEDSDIDAFL